MKLSFYESIKLTLATYLLRWAFELMQKSITNREVKAFKDLAEAFLERELTTNTKE